MHESLISEHEDISLHILAEVSQQIALILDIDDLLVRVVRLVQQTFNYYHVGIGLIEKGEVVYRVGAGILWDDPMFQFKPARLKIGLEGITGWVAKTGEPALIPDVAHDPRYVWMQGSQTRSEITVPISVKNQVVGVLDIQSQNLDNFEKTDIELMQAIANQTGIAIENARLFAETEHLLKETERRANKLAIINSVQQGLASKLDVQSIYELAGDKFGDIFDAQVVVISTYDQQSNFIEHRYAIERGVRIPWPGKHPPGGFRSQIIQTRKPFLLNIKVAEEAARLGQPILQGTETPKSWLGAPMLVGDQVIGILSVQSLERENAFDESDVHLMQTFAASMSIALENARLYENAKQVAVFEERQRMARELHDSVTQSLYGIELYSQAALGNLAVSKLEQVDKNLKDIHETSQEALAEMRLLIYELRPPILEKEGLVAVLQARLSSVEGRAGLKIKFKSELTERVSIDIEEGLCHVAQEALNNILKHAHAQNVSVNIGMINGIITMLIMDDGVGFDLSNISRGGLGLASMREHAEAMGGKLSVLSQPNYGTQITVEVEA